MALDVIMSALFAPLVVAALAAQWNPCAQSQIGDPPEAYIEFERAGDRYFLIIPPCCDQMIALVDGAGDYVCAPSGGITGHGAGDCPDWIYEQHFSGVERACY